MLKCISYWSLEGGLAGTCPIEDAISQTKSAGFDGIELAIDREGVLSTQTDQRTCEHYAALAREQGVALQTLASGMSWSCSPTHPDPTTRHLAIALHQDALQRAKWLGCDAVLFVPGATMIPWDPSYPHVPYAEASRWARDAIETLADTAESCGVDLCVENVWNGLFYSPEEFADVIDEIGSPRVGAYLDLGNLMGIHQWPPDWVRHLGPRIRRVHVKDYKLSVGGLAGFCELLQGDVPWKESIAALRAIGYDHTVVAEIMPPAPGLLVRTRAAMDQILDA